MLCSPSPAACVILSGREAKHAAEAGSTPSSPQLAAEGGPAASLAKFDPVEMLLFPSGPPGLSQLHEQQAGLDVLPFALGSKWHKVDRVSTAWLSDLCFGGGEVSSVLPHRITYNLFIDRILLDQQIPLDLLHFLLLIVQLRTVFVQPRTEASVDRHFIPLVSVVMASPHIYSPNALLYCAVYVHTSQGPRWPVSRSLVSSWKKVKE
ncbi:uncharacterized protein LOC133278682 [Pezoporus flaviventris]|uniref:uncharacterized protein LOC133278682 n=1 Tax=Pezoporus flaviventris TaxID=889875 RepID=UPI002AB1260E|nr:uncharacterized protein LOC133278682 [Pezoporus flaviventris]